ncbi:uncharacterized protein LOC110028550 [Phalaenopsis equestris]|uniref:uncharacterized protein LOC110028550 n=1 Tax=Phalaenopsis equestris TaxID=78828 RepID=UPI0009E2C015|nr:uncharacterized protein LOC110028550 [Phalaenopsis equestris]
MSAHSTAASALLNLLRPPFYSRRFLEARFNRSVLRASPTPSSDVGESYLDMWKKAVEREQKSREFIKLADGGRELPDVPAESKETVEQKTELFRKILDVPKEERDRVQRLQVIDRASAAISAARAFLRDSPPPKFDSDEPQGSQSDGGSGRREVVREIVVSVPENQGTSGYGTPGPDFWSWSPPMADNSQLSDNATSLQPAKQLNPSPNASYSVIEIEQSADILPLPLESKLRETLHVPLLPPLQSIVETEKEETESSTDLSMEANQENLEVVFSGHAAEAAEALQKTNEGATHGVNLDGSMWWRDSGVDQREDGLVYRWTLNRGVSADGTVEWEDKYWEASDQFEYKELGSEKSGRDANGNVWREYWREFMRQDVSSGLTHFEKSADKWGKNGKGDEWQEKWWEHYDDSGQTEKWAHKWCCIDPNTILEPGHAHIWHERWGEKYDGEGGSVKYTDKWAERSEGDGWTKWGDKWDEHFDRNGHGVKQGETWWEGRNQDRWNRTWGERHNATGWVHKYGKSSSGEHWDTHEQQDTWYERYPHYGFLHCFENSPQLRAVRKPPLEAA